LTHGSNHGIRASPGRLAFEIRVTLEKGVAAFTSHFEGVLALFTHVNTETVGLDFFLQHFDALVCFRHIGEDLYKQRNAVCSCFKFEPYSILEVVDHKRCRHLISILVRPCIVNHRATVKPSILAF